MSINNGRCIHCNRELLTGDFDGICSQCKQKINNQTEYVTFESKPIGYVKNIKIVNGKPQYDIEITDKEMIDKICNNSPKKMSVGYKKK